MASLTSKLSVNKTVVANLGKTIIAAAPALAPAAAANVLRRVLDIGIDGASKFPGAKAAAASALQKRGSSEQAINSLVKQHLAMAGAQGFLTNLGGFETMAVTMPANVSGMAIVQAHLVAAIAHLRGYDVDDPRVRGAVMMCMIGQKGVQDLVDKGELPSPMIVATAPVIDESLHATISEKVMNTLVANATGKRVSVIASKKIPLVGGGVGAAADSWSTWAIAQYAKTQFVDRHR